MAGKLVIAGGGHSKLDLIKLLIPLFILFVIIAAGVGVFISNRSPAEATIVAQVPVYDGDSDLIQLTPEATNSPVASPSASPGPSASPSPLPTESYEGPGVINANSSTIISGRNVAMLQDGTLVDKAQIDNQDLINVIDDENNTDTTLEGIANWITEDTTSMNDFIASHFGWPENLYDPKDYGLATGYMDQLIACLNPSYTHGCPDNPYETFTTTQQQNALKTSIFLKIQYSAAVIDSTQSKDLLKTWLSIGHPSITGISAIRVDYTDRVFDTIPASVVVSVRAADGNRYQVYMSASVDESGKGYYDVLDVELEK